ncbi:HNH endonuclease signature motif containing protein [Chelatococcus sp.]|uniref:HNH endonuclease signature motif containing protein n=1 Tax=Chelatococcus sp. TaxID=1953771 RepID=UPI001ECB43C2|nr:HNH endonuclease [Chelatococcus sp.]
MSNKSHAPLTERFWRFVDPSGADECWCWKGSRLKSGYGKIGPGGRGRPDLLAHRVSYEIHRGVIPDGLYVMHMCDNPPCVNPAHLSIGAPSQNSADMVVKGRNRYQAHSGEKNGWSVLTEEKVMAIHASADSTAHLARLLGVSESAVRDVRKRRTWTHLVC